MAFGLLYYSIHTTTSLGINYFNKSFFGLFIFLNLSRRGDIKKRLKDENRFGARPK